MRTCMLMTIIAATVMPAMPQTTQGEFRPFVATRKDQYWTESRRYVERHTTFARGADGSYAFISDKAAPNDPDQVPVAIYSQRFNALRRWSILTEPFTRTAVVTYIAEDRDLSARARDYGTCENLTNGNWKTLGRSSLLGFAVVEVEVDRGERSVTTEWVAPELQCYALRHTYVENGELRTKLEVVAIEVKEPDKKSFEPPAEHELVSPIEQEDRYRTMFPAHELFGRHTYELERSYQFGLAAAKDKQKQ